MNKEKATGYFLIVVSSILIIGYIFVFIGHIDFFVNAKDGTAEIVGHKESKKGDGVFIRLSYYNEYKSRIDTTNILFKYSTVKTLFPQNIQGNIKVLYTKWEGQVFVREIYVPAKTIFVFDLIAFGLLWLSMLAGISKIRVK
jgi:hypothetical protein